MIDIHTHTTCSDGTDTPRELVNKAIVQGLEVLGISDHDTTSGWAEATESLRGSLKLALGSEISCLTNDGVSVHMLGLLFDPHHEEMQQVLEETRDGRLPRMRPPDGDGPAHDRRTQTRRPTGVRGVPRRRAVDPDQAPAQNDRCPGSLRNGSPSEFGIRGEPDEPSTPAHPHLPKKAGTTGTWN